MDTQNSGGWLFAVLCCVFPIIWGGIWWAVGRYINLNPRAVRDIVRRRDL